jgi:diguanylate cyclase
LFLSSFMTVEACLAGLLALSLAGFGVLVWRELQHKSPNLPRAAAVQAAPKIAAAATQLDGEATAILKLVRGYIEAGERYSVTLAQAGKELPKLATPDEIGVIVKFLLAENNKMQNEARELKKNLGQSKLQIDNLRSNLAEAREMGMRDPLTSLNNRRRFDESLAKEVKDARARGAALTLVMADIDNFKKVNDVFGHKIGDEILKMFARVLIENARSSDIIARYGGEEFAVILPGTELEYALQVTERMRSQLEAKQMAVSESGQQIGKITASFGIAELAAGDNCDDLVHRADAKLYEAKCTGRNRIAADHAVAA